MRGEDMRKRESEGGPGDGEEGGKQVMNRFEHREVRKKERERGGGDKGSVSLKRET
jgi:hypothetical protein